MSINHKKIQIVLLVFTALVVLVILVVLVFRSSSKKQPSTIPAPTISTTGKEIVSPEETDIEKITQKISDSVSQQEKEKLTPLLPLNIENFSTSVGLTTNTNVFSIKSDPPQVIHLEIYGINYYLSDATPDNPNASAFKESFTNAKNILLEKGIDLNKLQVIYGTREYIQNTAEKWIKVYSLLP